MYRVGKPATYCGRGAHTWTDHRDRHVSYGGARTDGVMLNRGRSSHRALALHYVAYSDGAMIVSPLFLEDSFNCEG